MKLATMPAANFNIERNKMKIHKVIDCEHAPLRPIAPPIQEKQAPRWTPHVLKGILSFVSRAEQRSRRDIDLENWRRLEFRNEWQEPRESPRTFHLNRY